jgi:hypothetical protein
LDDSRIAELRELVRVADALEADDLAARARSLLALASSPERSDGQTPPMQPRLAPPRDDTLVRGGERYHGLMNVLGATGATALALSGAFYALAERDYRRWVSADDAVAGDALFQAWRGYETLSLGLGAGAIVSVGIGIPLLYATAATPDSAATPQLRLYTETERAARLNELYGERAEIVTALDRYEERGPRRDLTSTIGLATGVVGAITSVAAFYIAEERYGEYLLAPFSADAERLGRQVRLFDAIAVSAGTLSAAGFGVSAGVALLTRDRRDLEAALRDVNRRIIAVRTSAAFEVPDRGSVQTMLDTAPTDDGDDRREGQ